MRHPHGYTVTADPSTFQRVEADVIRCCHCQRLTEVPAGPMPDFPWCWKCGQVTCQSERCMTVCDPWEKQIERMESRARLLAAVGLVLLLLAAPAWADPPCTETLRKPSEVRVKCGDVEIGVRDNPDGTKDKLKKARGIETLGLVKTWKSERVKPEDYPAELDPVPDVRLGEVTTTEPTPTPAVATLEAPAVQRVLYVWTERAEREAGGPAAMLAQAGLAASIANNSYRNSVIPIVQEWEGRKLNPYVESSITTDLSRLRAIGDGYLDEVHGWRDEGGFDLVQLIGGGYAAAGACGLGYLNSSAPSAFSVVDRTCLSGRYSGAHELGHNQGAHHDPRTVCGLDTCNPIGSYNYGSPFGGLGTLLSYNGSRVQVFSGPTTTYNGLITGSATRNNVRKLTETAATVAGFRGASVPSVPVAAVLNFRVISTTAPPPPPPVATIQNFRVIP